MTTYQIHTIASAPEQSKPALEQLQQAFGFIPNVAASISNSPKLVTALVGVFQQVHSSSLWHSEKEAGHRTLIIQKLNSSNTRKGKSCHRNQR